MFRPIFPIPFWEFPNFGDPVFNQGLTDLAYKLKDTTASLERSNKGGFHTDDELYNYMEGKEMSKRFFEMCAPEIANDMSIDQEEYRTIIQNMWLNINAPGSYNAPHIHGWSVFSCAYFIKAPEGDCGKFVAINPYMAAQTCTPPSRFGKDRGYQPFYNHTVEIQPKEGTLVVFPGFLQHWVKPNNTKEDRISASFNIAYTLRQPADANITQGE